MHNNTFSQELGTGTWPMPMPQFHYHNSTTTASLCLAKCGVVVHFGCHYYDRFRLEISGDYFHAGCHGKWKWMGKWKELLGALGWLGFRRGPPIPEGGGLIELSPKRSRPAMHNDTQLNYAPHSLWPKTPAPLTLIEIDCDGIPGSGGSRSGSVVPPQSYRFGDSKFNMTAKQSMAPECTCYCRWCFQSIGSNTVPKIYIPCPPGPEEKAVCFYRFLKY